MNKLTEVLLGEIQSNIKLNKTNLLRLEGIDNPIIYEKICNYFSNASSLEFRGKMTLEKYNQFVGLNEEKWRKSLLFLHQGNNENYSANLNENYMHKSYVDFDGAITKWRNESANLITGSTVLILLMGTELATDKGGLDDFYNISPRELINDLKFNYSTWFEDFLVANELNIPDNRDALHTLYRTLFSYLNTDIFVLSDFIDTLDTLSFSNIQDVIIYICETLNSVWSIPSIFDTKSVPKVQSLKSGKLISAKIIANAIRFIDRTDDIPTASYERKLRKKFVQYALDNDVNVSSWFPVGTTNFINYNEFENCVIDFLNGRNLIDNRNRLLAVDYAIIDSIVGTKIKGGDPKPKAPLVTGEPVEAYSKMFLMTTNEYYEKYSNYPNSFSIKIKRVTLSNCTEDSMDSAFLDICAFAGGILKYFSEASIVNGDVLVVFKYEDFEVDDPFNYFNYVRLPESLIKTSGKWGDPCKIELTIAAENNGETCRCDYKWAFSPYAAWVNAFSYMCNVINRTETAWILPTLVVCDNMQDYLEFESEEEFYAQLSQLKDTVLYEEHKKEIARYFGTTVLAAKYDLVCSNFKDFAVALSQHGFYNALTELRKVVKVYSDLMTIVHDDYCAYTDVQREKLPLILNCFMITSNPSVIENCDMSEVILPAYHPVMLEKIDAKLLFIRSGFIEAFNHCINDNSGNKQLSKIDNMIRLASITQGVDTIFAKNGKCLTCHNIWEYWAVYYDTITGIDIVSGNSFGMSIVTDDEDVTAMLHTTPQSGIIVRNVVDYLRTFPARIDGLNIAFIAPVDMQHIVAAIHAIAKNLENNGITATINVKMICLNSKKNSATYLRRWLDSYFDDERTIKVNTYLKYITVDSNTTIDELDDLLINHDLCFVYNVLGTTGVLYSAVSEDKLDRDQAKFPMTFTPDTISSTHGKSRKVNISQFQFIASKDQTQATHIVSYPDSKDMLYRAYKNLELKPAQETIIEKAHERCKWVVCIDQAIDRYMLETNNGKIIGFTTGEGSYGELNVTVSARKDLLKDIRIMLRRRITDKFSNWDNVRLQKAANFCVDISENMDGSRILKALNPYDYEIHSYLAYILTLQILKMTSVDDSHIVRSLISLDSYKHWFAEDDRATDNKRPDFMLLEIMNTPENLDSHQSLKIRVKVIECKMGYKKDSHIENATTQLEKGIRVMSSNWNPGNTDVMHRYWLNQLYRAIIFSPLNMLNTTDEYNVMREKINGILNGNYEIEWTGDIFAFWLDENDDALDEWAIDSSLVSELNGQGIKLNSMLCHACGQMFIQKMLLPPEERTAVFEYNEVESDDEQTSIREDDETDNKKLDSMFVTGNSMPKQKELSVKFLHFVIDGQEHSRVDSLKWFSDVFKITEEDQRIAYESNGHMKWETILDHTISELRKAGLIENSAMGMFHATELGRLVAERATGSDAIAAAVAFFQKNQHIHFEPSETHDSTEESSIVSDEGSATDIEEHNLANKDLQTDNNNNNDNKTKQDLSSVRLLLGIDMRLKEKYYWEFGNKNLNNRHLLINGNSGSGKTYCIQGLLMEAALQGVSSVVFDYTGGFTSSKLDPIFKKALGDKIQQRIIRVAKIPVNPFGKHEIQLDKDFYVPENDVDIASKIAEIFATVYSMGDQQKSAVYSAVLAGIKIHGEKMNFRSMVDELYNIDTNYAKTVISKIQAFADIDPFAIDEKFDWNDIRDSSGMVYVVQLGGYGRDIQMLLTELLLWDIWGYCVKNGDESKPFILVLDEAQNLSHGDKSPSAKILTEGRKFGLSGWYATQFMKPQLSDDEIQRLQQAGQKLYFCPPDDGVMTVAKNIDINTQGAKEWSEKLKKLKKGECVTCGNMERSGRWAKYDPKVIKVSSLQERLNHD